MREEWLLTDPQVQMLLTLRRCVAARYYNEWDPADREALAYIATRWPGPCRV